MTSTPAGPSGAPGDAYAWPLLPILDPEVAAAVMAERLGAAYDDLEAERIHVITSLVLGRKALVNKFLGDFQAALLTFARRVEANVGELVAKHIGPVYEAGAKAASGEPDMTWTTGHTAALTALATDTYADFLQRSAEAGRVSEAFVRAVREAAATELPKLAAGGRTARQAADRLERSLVEDYGIDVITYRNGARVTPRSYARMATRTKSAVAYNAGTLNGALELGVGYVEVFDGPECGWTTHDDPDKANRSIRTVADAGLYAIAHPNCRRAFGPRPDVTSDDEAASALPTSTVAQEEDQRGADRLQSASSARVRAAAARRQRLAAKRAARRAGATTTTDQLADIIRAAREYVSPAPVPDVVYSDGAGTRDDPIIATVSPSKFRDSVAPTQHLPSVAQARELGLADDDDSTWAGFLAYLDHPAANPDVRARVEFYRQQIRDGIPFDPVQLYKPFGPLRGRAQVEDGHHRAAALLLEELPVPVRYADGSRPVLDPVG